MAAYEVLLLNTTLPQIQAAQSGDTYVVPRDITFSTNATFTTGTANGVMYLNGDKVVSTGSLLTFNGTTFTAPSLSLTNALSTTSGGTGLSSFTAGDLTYYSTGTALSKLAIGTANQVLTSSGTAPQWTSLSSIGVTSVSFGSTGLTPSSATAGDVSVAGTLVTSNGGTGLSSYTAGDLVYYSTGTALSKLAIGTASQILTSSGSAPQWSTASGISVGTATNLAGGAAGSVPYQSGAGATTFLSIGAANRVLTSTGSAPQWVTSLTGLTGVSSSSITNTALTSGRVVYSNAGGAQTDSASLTFDGTTFATTTVDTTNLEVTNIKAKDGTAAASIADSTGIISITSNPILSGGTANGVLYLNGSKVATSGSALVFDGTNLGVNVSPSASQGRVQVNGAGQSWFKFYDSTAGWNFGTFYKANGSTALGYIGSGGGNAIAGGTVDDLVLRAEGPLLFATNGGTERMRLDSSGNLGIGTSSPNILSWNKAETLNTTSGNVAYELAIGGAAQAYFAVDSTNVYLAAYANKPLLVRTNNTTVATFDTSGNLGLGVTPSAWGSGYKAFEFGGGGSSLFGGTSTATQTYLTANAYFNGTNWIYKNTNTASYYEQSAGKHLWYNAASGTGGTQITFTQAMTLGADGTLGVGTTSAVSADGTLVAAGSVGTGQGTANTVAQINIWETTSGNKSGLWFGAKTNEAAGVIGSRRDVGAITFQTYNGGWGERARITGGGYFKASNDGTYVESTQCHELRTTEDARAVIVTATNATYTSDAIQIRIARNTTNNSFYALSYYNTGAAAYKFRVADSGDVTNTNNSYGAISDAKMKTDIVDASSQWADIKAVRFRKFKMKNDPSGLVQLGVVAQELEQTSPGLIDEHPDYEEVEITDEDGTVKKERQPTGTTTKSVKTSVLLMKAAVALQEAMARIEQLEAKVAALESKGV